MKIESGRGASPSSGAKRAGSAAAAGFAVSVEAPQRAAAQSAVGGVTPLDAILALQAEEPLAERRARQARRGKAVLDALSELERGLALGHAPASLKAELDSLRTRAEPSGDEGLDGVLIEIDTRLAVELAKLERLAGRS